MGVLPDSPTSSAWSAAPHMVRCAPLLLQPLLDSTSAPPPATEGDSTL